MLSTPTAKTRKGITSTVKRVVGTFAKPKMPSEHATDDKTIIIPPTANVIFVSIC